MKRVVLALALVLMPVWLLAESTPRPFNLFLGAGLSFPTGRLNDNYGVGLNFEGAAGFDLVPHVQLLPTIAYHTFSLDNQVGDGGGLTIVMFGGDARFAIPLAAATSKPYLFAGLGFAHLATNAITTDIETIDSHSATEFFYDIGGGIERRVLGGLRMYFQVRYVNIATADQHTYMVPLTIGVRF